MQHLTRPCPLAVALPRSVEEGVAAVAQQQGEVPAGGNEQRASQGICAIEDSWCNLEAARVLEVVCIIGDTLARPALVVLRLIARIAHSDIKFGLIEADAGLLLRRVLQLLQEQMESQRGMQQSSGTRHHRRPA